MLLLKYHVAKQDRVQLKGFINRFYPFLKQKKLFPGQLPGKSF